MDDGAMAGTCLLDELGRLRIIDSTGAAGNPCVARTPWLALVPPDCHVRIWEWPHPSRMLARSIFDTDEPQLSARTHACCGDFGYARVVLVGPRERPAADLLHEPRTM